jgi:hypothetical protein
VLDRVSRPSVHIDERSVVPKASKQTASQVRDLGVLESRSEEPGGHTVELSPTEEYRRTLEVLAKNFAALQGR